MEKIITAIFIMVTIVTIIPNLIYLYKYLISKEYKDIMDAGSLHFLCLYVFSIFFIIKGCFVVYNYL